MIMLEVGLMNTVKRDGDIIFSNVLFLKGDNKFLGTFSQCFIMKILKHTAN